MRKARKSVGSEGGRERWLVSYADMLTLLFGLFVVLWASKQDGVSEKVVQESVVSVMQGKESELVSQYNALPLSIKTSMAPYVKKGLLEFSISNNYLEVIVFNDNIFDLGSAELSYKSTEPLFMLSTLISDIENNIVIEGHTDNLPISGGRYPSNWELSSARAASVLRFFERKGVSPMRMSIVGHGANKPVESNDTEDGRRKNRRVVVKILRDM